MKRQIETIRCTRKSLLEITKELTAAELNEIPKGFNNNIIWNTGHLIAAQQNVCYVRSGLKIAVEDLYFHPFKTESKPEKNYDETEIKAIRELLLSSWDRFEADYASGLFGNYTPWTNRYGVALNTIDEVLEFLSFHEGLHYGYVMALKRAIRIK